MSPTEKSAESKAETVSLQLDLRHAPEKVWRALTDPDLLAEWLLPVVDLELEPGATFTLTAPPKPGWDGTVHCRFLEIEERRKLMYSWVVGDGEIDTVVTFTLEPTAAGTHLTIEQSGFRSDQRRNLAGARYGWKMMGGRLVELLDRFPRAGRGPRPAG